MAQIIRLNRVIKKVLMVYADVLKPSSSTVKSLQQIG